LRGGFGGNEAFLKIVQRRQGEANGDSRGNHSCGIAGRGFGGPDGVSARLEKKGLVYLNFSQPETKGLSHKKDFCRTSFFTIVQEVPLSTQCNNYAGVLFSLWNYIVYARLNVP
jgi:hypothetical protein